MLATFTVEIVMAIYVVWRYKLTKLSRLVVATLFFLALFQISEYFVCGGAGLSAMHWSRTGYVAITMLPPLGLHILHVLTGKKERALVWVAYATAAAFIVYFLLYKQAFSGYECTGNYVIFQLGGLATALYAAYYYGWLGTAIVLGLRWRKQQKNNVRRQAIRGLIIGYLVFLVPTSIAVIIDPTAMRGIPSIMCGFAVIFAVLLTFYVLPLGRRAAKQR